MSQSHMSQSLKIEKKDEIKGTGFDSSVFTGESAEPSMNTGTVTCKRIALMLIVHGIKNLYLRFSSLKTIHAIVYNNFTLINFSHQSCYISWRQPTNYENQHFLYFKMIIITF